MSFLTESILSQYRNKTRTFPSDNIVNLSKNSYRDNTKPMIFLSHKHDEHSILQDVIGFLKSEGVDVYVDWMDPTMPAYTNAETAHKLKEKIQISDKFILIATPDAIDSKWCNWELGLGDTAKYINNIALFPINQSHKTFKGSEYLSIYPYIEYEDGTWKYIGGAYIPKGYYVKIPIANNKVEVIPLKLWLKSK